MQQMQRFTAALVFSLVCAACAPAPSKPPPQAGGTKPAASVAGPKAPTASRLDQGWAALEASRYAAAEAHFRAAAEGADRAWALTGLANVQLVTGRYSEAATGGAEATELGGPSKLDAAWVRAEALRRQGHLDEAARVLRTVEADPKARRVRLALGEVLIEMGRRQDAEAPLMTLVEDYNDDRINKSDPMGLAMVGRAAHLLRSAVDANDAFNEAENAADANVQTLLWRAELFLEKYDPGHAEEVIVEVLEKAPNHPDARVWLAHVKLVQALDFDAAEAAARRALAVNPKHSGAHFVLAGISLRDMELREADARARAGLKHHPRDLDLLSMKAAVRFLADDRKGFERAKKRVLDLNPQFSRMYQILGDFADWEHRYEEIVVMMREGLAVDPEDGKALAMLGLNLIRSGEERVGVQTLGRAFRVDPFNVRVYNTLNLYEKVIPESYVTVDGKRFRIRYHKAEKKILERYIPQLLEKAWKKYVLDYGFTPAEPVGVELYAERQNFAIRTSGLPNTAIQGVCFGKTLASMSPKNESFNLGMTLWHELAHVFHIQQSKNHVPRWFTEGLAEYETLRERYEWRREQDPALYQGFRSGRLPRAAAMNRAFTRAEEMADIAMAYYASSQIVTMLAEGHGMRKMAKMLELWGAGKRTPEVLSAGIGLSPEELDQQFRHHAKHKLLARYDKQFVPIGRTGPYAAAKRAAEEQPKNPRVQTVHAIAALKKGKKEEAENALARALTLDPKFPDARWVQARMALSERKLATAKRHLDELLRHQHDGYVVRMFLAQLALAKKDHKAHRSELEKAHQFDPTQSEPLHALVEIEIKEGKSALPYLRKLAKIDEHDARVFRRLINALIDAGEIDEAIRVGESAIWADIEGLWTHSVYADALAARGRNREAIYELESALLCSGKNPAKADVHARLAGIHKSMGNAPASRRHVNEARKLDPGAPRLKSLGL